jgi:hypothetical protein
VNLHTTYGDVELPRSSGRVPEIRRAAEDGELHSNVPGLEILEDRSRSRRAWTGTLGLSTHAVSVETSYGDIHLEPVES